MSFIGLKPLLNVSMQLAFVLPRHPGDNMGLWRFPDKGLSPPGRDFDFLSILAKYFWAKPA
jgi:hypothetical protein